MYSLPWWLSGKEPTCNARNIGSILWSVRYLGEGNGNTLQDSCLENFMDRGAWWTTFSGLQRVRDTTEQLTVENGWYQDLTRDENRSRENILKFFTISPDFQ